MNEKINKRVELCANIGITLLTLMGGYLLIRSYLFNKEAVTGSRAAAVTTKRVPLPGAKIAVPGINWEDKNRTLLFVMSSSCKYCKESAPFYQRIVKETQKMKDLRLVALLPQDVEQGEKYLNNMGIAISEVKHSEPGAVGASGFPTLIMVDKTGTIKKAWVGKLSADKEVEVITQLKCTDCS